MFGSYRTEFLPSTARYSPLSGKIDNRNSQTGVDENFHPEVEKALGDKPPSFKSRLTFALLGTLIAVFLLGGTISALGSTDADRSRVEGDPPSRMTIKQFAPKGKHLRSDVH